MSTAATTSASGTEEPEPTPQPASPLSVCYEAVTSASGTERLRMQWRPAQKEFSAREGQAAAINRVSGHQPRRSRNMFYRYATNQGLPSNTAWSEAYTIRLSDGPAATNCTAAPYISSCLSCSSPPHATDSIGPSSTGEPGRPWHSVQELYVQRVQRGWRLMNQRGEPEHHREPEHPQHDHIDLRASLYLLLLSHTGLGSSPREMSCELESR